MNRNNLPPNAIAKLSALETEAAAGSDSARAIYERCCAWIGGLHHTATVTPVVFRTDDLTLEDVRKRIDSFKEEIKVIEEAPPSSFTQIVRDYVDRLGRRGAPTSLWQNGELAPSWSPDVAPIEIMCWLFPGQVIARLEAELGKQVSSRYQRLPYGERRQEIGRLRMKLIDCGYVEEQLVFAAIARGEKVEHRPDVRPEAVLGVRAA